MPLPPKRQTSTLRWSSLRTELLWAYDRPVADESLRVQSDHRHGFWVWLIREGSVRLETESNALAATAGQWVVSPHRSIVQNFTEGARILSVHFRCQWPTGEELFEIQDGLVFEAADYPQLERSASSLQRLVHAYFPGVRLEFLQQTIDYPVFLKVQQCFLQWLMDFYEALVAQGQKPSRGGEGDERLWQAAECLHATPLDRPFPGLQLQRESSLGRAQLDRLFWKAFGASTREYWEQLRQESAISSIESSTMPIKEIGYCLGFKQPSHFTKWFVRRVGSTPQDYRLHAVQAPHWKTESAPVRTSAPRKNGTAQVKRTKAAKSKSRRSKD